jgi:O-antigen/teichoic acid export membrane protein
MPRQRGGGLQRERLEPAHGVTDPGARQQDASPARLSDYHAAPVSSQTAPTSLRSLAARGTVVNAGFSFLVSLIGLIRGIAVASFLTASDYGLWGLIAAVFVTLLWLAAVGFDDKYIQQNRPDQEAAFQVAFTLQTLLCAAFMVLVIIAVPLFALLYDAPEIVGPGLVLGLTAPAIALQTPLWVFWRRMDFFKQRVLQIWDPVVSLVVTLGLAAAGLDLWALVIGTLAGSWTAAAAAVIASPYALRFRWEKGALREYASFSWPLFVGSASVVLVTQLPLLVASRWVGLTAVGAIALASNISIFANRVDEIVTQTLYPAVCAVRDRADLLFESFVKSNRLALLWAAPCGVAVALFADDFVHFVIGDHWQFAVTLIQVFGLTAAVNQIGFNWTAYYRARGETRPIAVANVIFVVAVGAIAVPLLADRGVDGFAAGMAAATLVFIGVRLVYVARLFPALRIARHVAKALAPTVPAAALVLGIREVFDGTRSPGRAIAELAVFTAVVLAATLILERRLLSEALGYWRGAPVVNTNV